MNVKHDTGIALCTLTVKLQRLDELSLIAVVTAGTGVRSVLKCGNEGKQSRVVWDSPRGGVIKDTP